MHELRWRVRLGIVFALAVLCLCIATLPSAAVNTLTVNASQPLYPFTHRILGLDFVNWEHSWGKPFPNSVPGLAQAMRAAGVGIIRYAGGNWANSVGFDPARTQITPFTAWTYNGQTYYFNYGTDEITSVQAFAQALGADIIVQANISNNDPSMWANMVQYTNTPGKYPVRYWEIGNELDFASPPMDPTVYANRIIGYQSAMYANDPTIKIVSGVPAAPVPQTGSNSALNGLLLIPPPIAHTNGHDLDSVSYHWYMQCNTTALADVLRYRFYDGLGNPINPTVWNNAYSRYWADYLPGAVRAQITSNYPGMPQGITELNVDACNYDNVYNGNHISALWFSDVLGRLAYSGLDYATMYEGYGTQGYGMLYPDNGDAPTRIYNRPSYYAYLMYAKYFGNQLVQSSSYKNDDISIWASTDSADPGKLKLRVTNMTNAAITVPVDITGFNAASGLVYTLQSNNPTDTSATSNTANAGTNINGVKIDAMNVDVSVASIVPQPLVVVGGSFTYTFPAYTSVAIVLSGGGSPVSPTATPTVTSTAATRTPTPTSTATATGTATATRTATATATATGTATVTGSPTTTRTATATRTTTATRTATLTAGPTATPTPYPKPNVGVSATASGGALQATITARDAGCAGGNNQLQSLQFTALSNATVEVATTPVTPVSSTPTMVTLPTNTATIGLTVRRVTPSEATMVMLTVTDGCGSWPTFVGGGPNAW